MHSDVRRMGRHRAINCLYSIEGASFFEGTTKLSSRTHEDSASIANFLIEAVDRLEPPVATVIHVVTDTYLQHNEGRMEDCRAGEAVGECYLLRSSCSQPVVERHSHNYASEERHGQNGAYFASLLGSDLNASNKAARAHYC